MTINGRLTGRSLDEFAALVVGEVQKQPEI